MALVPRLLTADESGKIREDRNLLLLCSRGGKLSLPSPDELAPLPRESELFLLPGRKALGFNPKDENVVAGSGLAVAAFAAPGYTISANPAYLAEKGASLLPLFAYAAVGYARGKYWICAKKVDDSPRQKFEKIPAARIRAGARMLLENFPENRLIAHIIHNCVEKYDCPAARNFALGRYEAPLPTSRSCNASCLGCLSAKNPDSPVQQTPQCRLDFTPSSSEIVEVMHIHEKRERRCPVYSFGQGCEGDPLMNSALLAESIRNFRKLRQSGEGGEGTINCNTNASNPQKVAELCEAGLTSIRISLNSTVPEIYEAYYRPSNYSFSHVGESARTARKAGVFASLNLLYFPGVTDTARELASLASFCRNNGVEMIQLRNLNIDPEWYLESMEKAAPGIRQAEAMGLNSFLESLHRECPWLKFGYFNPWLGTRAELNSPLP